jgi:hypothetical protein
MIVLSSSVHSGANGLMRINMTLSQLTSQRTFALNHGEITYPK